MDENYPETESCLREREQDFVCEMQHNKTLVARRLVSSPLRREMVVPDQWHFEHVLHKLSELVCHVHMCTRYSPQQS